MSFEDVCKVLCNEPFWLKPSEIAQLTPWQVKHLYLCERNDSGQPKIEGSYKARSIREIFYDRWFKLGLHKYQVDILWHEYEAKLNPDGR